MSGVFNRLVLDEESSDRPSSHDAGVADARAWARLRLAETGGRPSPRSSEKTPPTGFNARGRPQFADDRTDHWPPPLFSPWLSLGFFRPSGLLPLSSANCRESGRFPFPLRGRTHRTKGRSRRQITRMGSHVNSVVDLAVKRLNPRFKHLELFPQIRPRLPQLFEVVQRAWR